MDVKMNFLKKNLLFLFLSITFFCSSSFYTLTNEQNLSSLLEKSLKPKEIINAADNENTKTILADTKNKPSHAEIDKQSISDSTSSVSTSGQSNLEISSLAAAPNSSSSNSRVETEIKLPTFDSADKTNSISETVIQNTDSSVNPITASDNTRILNITPVVEPSSNVTNVKTASSAGSGASEILVQSENQSNYSETNLTGDIFLEDVSVAPEMLATAIPSQNPSKLEAMPVSPISEIKENKTAVIAAAETAVQPQHTSIQQNSTSNATTTEIETLGSNKESEVPNTSITNEHPLLLATLEDDYKFSLLNSYHKLNSNENFSPFLEGGLNTGFNSTAVMKPAAFNLRKSYTPSPARITLAKNQEKSFYYKIGGARIQWATWSSN